MKLKLIAPMMILAICPVLCAQTMIGRTKEEIREIVKKDHKGFRPDNTIVRQQFNYLKYVNSMKTRTWILYFNDHDICKTSKLVCDYSEFNDVMEELGEKYEKAAEDRWEYREGPDHYQVVLTKQEWYFTLRETKKAESP